MHPVRDFFAEWAENWSHGFGGLFQNLGVLPDGRELVDEIEESAYRVVTIPDRSDEGWPGFTFCIPVGAHFDRAHNSILGRRAAWFVPGPHDAVVRQVLELNPDFPPPAEDLRRETTHNVRGVPQQPIVGVGFRLKAGVELSVVGFRPEASLLAIRQRRPPDALEQAMKTRVSSMGKMWGKMKSEAGVPGE